MNTNFSYETIENLCSHKSIRKYIDKPVNKEDLERIIRSVQSAPNWNHLQHISIIAIKEKKRREIFAKLCGNQKQIAQAPIFLVFCADFYRTWLACKKEQHFDETMKKIDNIIVGANEVGIAVGTAVIAAESIGLGTVVIGDIRLHALEVIKELNIPKYVIPMLGLCIGYPDENPEIKPRLPKEAVFFEEKYEHNLDSFIEQYNKVYANYLISRSCNNRIGNWTNIAEDFYKRPYNHYPEVSEMLNKQGFYSEMEKK